MRELKFRAWDKKDKRIITHKQGFIPLLVSNWGVFRLNATHANPLYNLIEKERFEIMQYAGLKDSRNSEIYEGDIISVHQFLFDGNEIEKEWIARVVFIDDCASFGLKVISGEFALEHTGYESYNEMPPFAFSEIHGLHEESFKVISNIYEQPELV